VLNELRAGLEAMQRKAANLIWRFFTAKRIGADKQSANEMTQGQKRMAAQNHSGFCGIPPHRPCGNERINNPRMK